MRRHARAFLAAALGLALGALIGAVLLGWPIHFAPGPGTRPPDPARVGAPFALIDHRGRPVTDRDFRGRLMLVLFGSRAGETSTRAALQIISAALNRLGEDARTVTAVFVTLSPEEDKPEWLAHALGKIDPRIVGLTGDKSAVSALARAYHVPSRPLPNDPEQRIPDPARILYVMDENGAFLFHVAMPVAPEELALRLVARR